MGNILFKPTKRNRHTFSKPNSINVLDSSTYRPILEFEKEYLDKFNINIYDNISESDKMRIFFLSEYIKRQFYLDCNVDKDDNGNYKIFEKKKSREYVNKCCTKREDIYKYLVLNFIMTEKETNEFYTNIDGDEELSNFDDSNVYNFIKDSYKYYLNKLIKILKNPQEYFYKGMSEDKKEIIINFSKINHDIYEYERILYYLGDRYINFSSLFKVGEDEVVKFIDQISLFKFRCPLLPIYMHITDIYFLYISDLLKITNMEEIMSNNYQIPNLPRFFFLPKDLSVGNKIDDIVESYLDVRGGEMKISIDLDQENFDSIEIAEHIRTQIILALYPYKEYTRKKYSESEAKKICEYIDTYTKKNSKNDPKKRVDGLFIWDSIHILKKNPSINARIKNDAKILGKVNEKSVLSKYQKYVRATCQCIEKRELYPMS